MNSLKANNEKEGGRAQMNNGIEFGRKLSLAYEVACKPLCRELKLTQTAFDILMFLANNPEYTMARDIVEIRKLKANLVSVNVDKLVKEGYLVRESIEGDRRKTRLLLTPKADEIVIQGRALQRSFAQSLFSNIDENSKEILLKEISQMERNLDQMIEEEK